MMHPHEALVLIDDWIDRLDEDELSPACQQENESFFDFIKLRGYSRKDFIETVVQVTGTEPENLYRVEDLLQLREYIRAYCYSRVYLSNEDRYRDTNDRNNWFKQTIRKFFG